MAKYKGLVPEEKDGDNDKSTSNKKDFWSKFIARETEKDYIKEKVIKFVNQKRLANIVYPDVKDIFRAYVMTKFEDIKVIILGQDPYHDGNADGLAFSCKKKLSPSLQKILESLGINGDMLVKVGGFSQAISLESWAKQGVMLLNIVLTVDEGKPHSHANIGWEQLVGKSIGHLLKKPTPKVFLIWGKVAQEWFDDVYSKTKVEIETPTLFDSEITKITDNNLVIYSEHPAYASYQKRGWDNNNCFIKTNEYLIEKKLTAINWKSMINF